MKKINIITLGCSKNIVDSEVLATFLEKNNFKIFFDADFDIADNIIINTCGFINDAKEESINTIFDALAFKKNNPSVKIFAIGCLTQRYRNEITKEIPQLDGIFGVNDIHKIIKKLNADYKKNSLNQRLISTPSHYAFLKIAEGCNRNCSFCAIPFIRGKHISKPIEKIVSEARFLTEKNVKELLLISQDTSYYGKDLYNYFALNKLIENLLKTEKLEWLRLHYLYPSQNIEKIINLMKSQKKFCNYIDIPFQHISDKILKSMQRGHSEKRIKNLIDFIKKTLPEATLRTTMIVGYPGETEKDFYKLIDFIKEVKFDRLGAFTYSEEDGTAAAKLKDNIPEKIKQQRLNELMQTQSAISLEKNSQKVGKNFKVIIDRKEKDFFIARTEADSPEVDNEVIITSKNNLKIGKFYNAKIISADEYDLFAQIQK